MDVGPGLSPDLDLETPTHPITIPDRDGFRPKGRPYIVIPIISHDALLNSFSWRTTANRYAGLRTR
jgi:hypothetical protein